MGKDGKRSRCDRGERASFFFLFRFFFFFFLLKNVINFATRRIGQKGNNYICDTKKNYDYFKFKRKKIFNFHTRHIHFHIDILIYTDLKDQSIENYLQIFFYNNLSLLPSKSIDLSNLIFDPN